MKTMKYLSMMLLMLVTSVCMFSCSDDDDAADSGYQDYYIEIDLSGGGFDSQELNALKAELNTELSDYYWEKVTRDEVIYDFNLVIESLEYSFSEGVPGLPEPLRFILYLKTSDGTTVRTATLTITSTGCTVS